MRLALRATGEANAAQAESRRRNTFRATHLNSVLHKLCGKPEQAHEEDKTATKVRRFTPHDLRSTMTSTTT
jgi:hypothetical protein